MRVATYNINSIRARASNLLEWLKKENPDIVFLQEIKCETENFLYFECESLGYKVAVEGQKSYNGVAILCKYDFEITNRKIPNFDDENARFLEIKVTKNEQKFYAISIYAPNGCSNDKNTEKEKLSYKLNWFDKLYERLKDITTEGLPIIIGGDFNVMMSDLDAYDSIKFKNSPLFIKDVRDKIEGIKYLGLFDSFRLLHPKDEGYTFWDYTGNSFVTNLGLRIDYLFVSAFWANRIEKVYVDKLLRKMDKPSDHTALVMDIRD